MGARGYINTIIILSVTFLVLVISARGQGIESKKSESPQDWIFGRSGEGIKGLGIAKYSSFNPDKAWKKALQNGVEDLNSNHSLIVYYHGRQVGRGPLRTESKYAIRTFLDTTQVAVVDSARWQGRAFVLVEPAVPVPDSVLYPGKKFRDLEKNTSDLPSAGSDRWLQSRGSTPRIDSNWHMTITKAKQNALRRLAEYLATKVSTETYQKDGTSRRYLNFSTMFAFQRIRILERTFTPDSVKVEVAVDPREVKMLMD